MSARSAGRGDGRKRVAALAAALLAAPVCSAFSVEHHATRYADRRFHCELTVMLDAPIDRVEAVLRDYERYPMLDPRILEAQVLERPSENVALIETLVRACFGPFCRNVKRVERVEEAEHSLAAVTDASRSDVKFGETHTALEPLGDGATRVIYRTSITPGFWIPPLVGRRWMLNKMEDAASDLFMNVEMRASGEAL